MIGSHLSHYRILELLGAGGMGVVYRARDERLERDVAIKVLPAGALADEAARKQFRKEALALSKLNHPNIATIHDFDSQEGTDFLVMELVPGETLRDRLRRGPLAEREILSFGGQLAEGLEAAHEAGVLHRDIKPGNLHITSKGNLKILDFGLAKRILGAGDTTVTESLGAVGHVAGTLPYMSPEQLRGGTLDARSDVHAAGAVLYEMAVGARAFAQEPATRAVGAILHEPPMPPREAGARISADLERIILRCLEKDPAQRYATARDLGADLREVASPSGRRIKTGRRSSAPIAIAIAGAALVAMATLVITLDVGGVRGRIFSMHAPAIPSLAVLPLMNLSHDPEQEYFADGMTDELITRLAQVGALRVISRTSAMQYKGTKKMLREIAKDLGVRYIVEGSILRVGNAVRVSAELVEAAREQSIWAERYQRDLTNVLLLQSDLAEAIVQRIEVRLTPAERGRMADAHPVDAAAHEAYLRGRSLFNQNTLESGRKAIEQFEHAIQIDPQYTAAFAGLADTYCALSSAYIPANEAMPRARAAATKALELDPNFAAAHASLAYVQAFYDWDMKRGEQSFRRAIELNPGEVTAHQFLGQLLTITGRFDEASREIERARSVDPLSSYISAMTVWPLYFARRYDEAAAVSRKLIDMDPNFNMYHLMLGEVLLNQGKPAAGLEEINRAHELEPGRPINLAWQGHAYARMGARREAMDVLARLRTMSATSYVQPYAFAMVFASLGEKDSAFAALDEGFKLRSEEMIGIKYDPALDELRSDPRFAALLRRMGFST